MISIAASSGADLLGSLGAGGVAFVLTLVLILGTRPKSAHTLPKNVALVVGLAAGTAWMGAGQVWGMPNDLVLTGLSALGIGSGGGQFGEIGMGAIALGLAVIAYLVRLQSRTAGITGVVMASVFSLAGGAWAAAALTVGQFTGQFT